MTAPLASAIDATWTAIRARNPQVPAVTVQIVPADSESRPRRGHTAEARWVAGNRTPAELVIGGDGLDTSADVLLVQLLHAAAHGIAHTTDVNDVSRQGRYHNTAFRRLAEGVGLAVRTLPDTSTGWVPAGLTDGTADLYATELGDLTRGLGEYRDLPVAASLDKTFNGVVAVCRCDEPRRIRIRSRETFEVGPILCGVCRYPFAATT